MGFSKLMHEGGFPMFFILIFGVTGLVSAILYARQPSARLQALTQGMGRATLFSTLAALAADLGATWHTLAGGRLPNFDIRSPEGPTGLLMGMGESMAPLIMGFALLALLHVFHAVGSYRSA